MTAARMGRGEVQSYAVVGTRDRLQLTCEALKLESEVQFFWQLVF